MADGYGRRTITRLGYLPPMLPPLVRKQLYNACDPSQPLGPEDPRNVDVDAIEGHVRGKRWVDQLALEIELADRPTITLFTGLPGSGKSTELRRLRERLQNPLDPFLPVLVDAEDVLDFTSPIDVSDILVAVVSECDVAVRVLEGAAEASARDAALNDGPLTRFWTFLTRTDIEFTKAEWAVPAGGKLVAEMKTRPSLRQRVRATVGNHLTTFLADMRAEIAALDQRAKALGRKGIVVLFDSLEKLGGTTANWDDVLASAEQLFSAGAPYLRLPVPVIYTVPPALVNRRLDSYLFMPMIKLATKDGTAFGPGYSAARSVVRKRVPDERLRQLLGPDADARLDRIIRWSGGYPRELLRMLKAVVAVPVHPITGGDLDRILNEVRDSYRQIVPADAYPWLARVAVTQYLTLSDDAHRPSVDHMLSNNVILRYLNDELWFDLHPAVKEIPGIQAAMAAARADAAPGPDGR